MKNSQDFHPRVSRLIPISAVTLIAVPAIYLGICALVLSASLSVQRKIPSEIPADILRIAEPIRFQSMTGHVPLRGSLLRSSGDRAIVLVHGKKSYGFEGAHVEIARAYVKAGFHVLVFDLRGHGRSGDSPLGLGWHERGDVHAAVKLLLRRGFEPGRIGVHGTSYGAAIALLSAAIIQEIGAVVADSAFADVRDLMGSEIEKSTGVPARVTNVLLRPGLALIAWLGYGLDLDVIAPEKAVPKIAPRPILFIHGGEDRTIPVEQAYRLKAASRNTADELWILEGFGHTEGVLKKASANGIRNPSPMREEFLEKVTAFFDQTLR